MVGKNIKIIDYPNDVYKAVGKIIKHSQEWDTSNSNQENWYNFLKQIEYCVKKRKSSK